MVGHSHWHEHGGAFFDITKRMRELKRENEELDREDERARERGRLKDMIMPRKTTEKEWYIKQQKEQAGMKGRSHRGFFCTYDDTNFENKELPKMIEGGEKPFFEKMA